MTELATIEVRAGDRLAGRYKRSNREANAVDLQVEATIVYTSARGSTGMLIGTNLDLTGIFGGQRVGLRASCFDPRGLAHTPGFEASDIDPEGIYLTPGSDAFAFVEEVKPEDREWAEMMGGQPISAYLVDSLKLAVVREGEPEPDA
jgi:hypothetical protein